MKRRCVPFISFLFLLGSGGSMLLAVVSLVVKDIFSFAVGLILAIAYFAIGLGLRNCKKWAAITSMVLIGLNILGSLGVLLVAPGIGIVFLLFNIILIGTLIDSYSKGEFRTYQPMEIYFSKTIGTIIPSKERRSSLRSREESLRRRSVSLAEPTVRLKTILKIEAIDYINSQWKAGEVRKFYGEEIKIGRSSRWSDLRIGQRWKAVSRRHGIILKKGDSFYYMPVSTQYSFSLDGKPYSTMQELSDGVILNLVSGYGPKMRIRIERKTQL